MQRTFAIKNSLNEKNKGYLESSFLQHASHAHYEGECDFSPESGLRLEWGKYDYWVPKEEQEPDMDMLIRAASAFNEQHSGCFYAFVEMGDKYNTVQIMDLLQLSGDTYLMESDPQEVDKHLAFAIQEIQRLSGE